MKETDLTKFFKKITNGATLVGNCHLKKGARYSDIPQGYTNMVPVFKIVRVYNKLTEKSTNKKGKK